MYVRDAEDFPDVSCMKPAGVMVRAAVTFDLSKFSLVFIAEAVRMNTLVC